MLRKSHKKSRKGCQACKRSHKKCDETHPSCLNCTTTKTTCTYTASSHKAVKDNFVLYTPPDEDKSLAPSLPSSIAGSSPQSSALPHTPPAADPYVNMLHLELFQNTMSGATTFSTENRMSDEYLAVVLKYTFNYPYLMASALAFSALHLSITSPYLQKRHLYLTESRLLQSHALTLFNTTHPTLPLFLNTAQFPQPPSTTQNPQDTSTLIPIFLFSSTLGLHFFTTTFSNPHPNLHTFLSSLIQSIHLLRGVNALIDSSSWEAIKSSDIAPILQTDETPISRDDTVTQAFSSLSERFAKLASLSSGEAEAYNEAIERLLFVYNSQPQNNVFEGPANARTVMAWPITLSAAYTELLDLRKPEALVIMAYFSILLHSRRSFWAVGNGGRFLLSAIDEHLGQDWAEWLNTPKIIVLG